jgi:hypothetical protein
MAGSKDIAISREYMAAKRAYEISESRIRRQLNAYAKWQYLPPPRRPIGAPKSVVLSQQERSNPISSTHMNLHINAFVRYVKALRNYYQGRPSEFIGAIRQAFKLLGNTQYIGRNAAAEDVMVFIKYLADEFCQKAVRQFRPKAPRSIGELFLALEIAQFVGASSMPGARKAQKIAESVIQSQ